MLRLGFMALLSFVTINQSCQKEDDLFRENAAILDGVEPYVPKGKLLKNPYEISNMRRAYKKVLEKLGNGDFKAGKGFRLSFKGDTTEIEPNYLYLRFDPTDSIQEFALTTHKDIIFLDYPFEYEEPEDYKAAFAPEEGKLLSYWCSVPMEQQLPDVPYEVLQEMYLPEADPEYNDEIESGGKTSRGQVNNKVDLMNHVLELAYTSTGNEDLLPEPPERVKGETCETCFLGINLRARWTPRGNVQIWDDNLGESTTRRRVFVRNETYPCEGGRQLELGPLGPVGGDQLRPVGMCTRPVYRYENVTTSGSYTPLAGAQILARDTWTIAQAIADNNGNWTMKRIRAKARFLVQWERYEFSIRDNTGIFQAEDKGPKLHKQKWNYRIKGGREEYRGHIFQAAMHYYYHDIGGLTRPPSNSSHSQMKMVAREINDRSSYVKARKIYLGADIKIKEWGKSSEEVYGTTIHELAHAAHRIVDGSAYNDVVWDAYTGPCTSFNGCNNLGPTGDNNRRLLESWATGVEIFLTRMHYRGLGETDYEYNRGDDGGLNEINEGNYQARPIEGSLNDRHYTSAVWDMVDNFNQRTDFGRTYNNRPQDRVSGFTMPQLERALRGARYWNGYRNNIINQNPDNPTVNRVAELFANWD